jgi:hypothetical protein
MESVGVGGFAVAAELNLLDSDGMILLDADGNPLTLNLGG